MIYFQILLDSKGICQFVVYVSVCVFVCLCVCVSVFIPNVEGSLLGKWQLLVSGAKKEYPNKEARVL